MSNDERETRIAPSDRQERTAARMMTWAKDHPECDTQGILEDEWLELAAVALDDQPTADFETMAD
jgi:hypothetical protein